MTQQNLLPVERISRTEFDARGVQGVIAGDRPLLIDWIDPRPEHEIVAQIELGLADIPVALFCKSADPASRERSRVVKIPLPEFFAEAKYRHSEDGLVHRVVANICNLPSLIEGLLGEPAEPVFDHRWPGNSVNLWINYQGQFGRVHFDELENFNLQLVGRKRFVLSPPGTRNYYVRSLLKGFGHHSDFPDLLAVDPARYPRFASNPPPLTEALLNPGQMLYIPIGWWHQVDPLSPLNINMNFWLRHPKLWRRPYVLVDAIYKAAFRKLSGRYDYEPEKPSGMRGAA